MELWIFSESFLVLFCVGWVPTVIVCPTEKMCRRQVSVDVVGSSLESDHVGVGQFGQLGDDLNARRTVADDRDGLARIVVIPVPRRRMTLVTLKSMDAFDVGPAPVAAVKWSC